MANFRVVSRLRQPGNRIDIPDDASNVTVQQLAADGTVRVTYLEPIKEIPFESGQPRRGYVE